MQEVKQKKVVKNGLTNKQEKLEKRSNVNKYGNQRLTFKEDSVLANEKRKMKTECPNCRHLINFYAFEHVDKKLCDYCRLYVFKNKKIEFEYRMKQFLKKEENKNETNK